MHYYNFHIGDYKSHTYHLTVIQDCAFRRLLDHYYLHEAPIKQRDIARQINMSDYEQEVLSVLNEFFHDSPNGYIHPRADKEIEAYHAKIQQASKAGKASAERRFNERSTDVQPTNNQEPITNNHIYSDFEKILKAKRKPLTDTLLDSIQDEANKAKLTLDQALKICCERGWTTFKAEWIVNKADIVHQTVPSTFDRDPVLVKLDEEAKLLTTIPEDVKAKFKMLKGGK
jgi:uncharacterized protein YdaU (DUF1376 family)